MVRSLVVLISLLASFVVPNINILLQFGGAIIATFVSVIIPVTFYNRAYNDDQKNLERDSGDKQRSEDDVGDSDSNDNRKSIRVCNYIVLIIGCSVGIYGFVEAIIMVSYGDV